MKLLEFFSEPFDSKYYNKYGVYLFGVLRLFGLKVPSWFVIAGETLPEALFRNIFHSSPMYIRSLDLKPGETLIVTIPGAPQQYCEDVHHLISGWYPGVHIAVVGREVQVATIKGGDR